MLKWLGRFYALRIAHLERKYQLQHKLELYELESREREHELYEQQNVCHSCETLRLELARAHDENMRLIDVITRTPATEPIVDTENLKPIRPARHIPFSVRRQVLEAEDRAKARILSEQQRAEKAAVVDETLTADLEKEMQVVAAERDLESGVRLGDIE